MTTTVRQKTCRWLSGLLQNFISILEWEHKAQPNFGSMCHHISFSTVLLKLHFFCFCTVCTKSSLWCLMLILRTYGKMGEIGLQSLNAWPIFKKYATNTAAVFAFAFFWIKKMKFKKFEIIYIRLWSHQSSSE